MEATDLNDAGSIDAVAASLMDEPAPKPEPVDQAEDEDAAGADDAPEADAQEEDAQDADEPEGDDTDDEADEDRDAVEEPAKGTYSVKVDGKDVTVTLDELRRGYSGQTKIQQGMQEVASAKKQVEQVYASLQAQVQQLEQLRTQAASGKGLTPPTPPDRELLKTDPIGYMEARAEFDDAEAAWKQSQTAYQQHSAQRAQAMEQARMAKMAEQAETLRKQIPDFADPVKAKALQASMTEYAAQIGYTPAEISAIDDARVVSVLHDAMRYRKLMAARKSADANTAQPRQAIRPGAKRSEATTTERTRRQAAERMRETGDLDDVAKFLIS